MNPNLLPDNSPEALRVRKPKNELVSNAAQQRLAEDVPGITNAKAALEVTITNAASALLREHSRMAMRGSVATMPQNNGTTRQPEYRPPRPPQEQVQEQAAVQPTNQEQPRPAMPMNAPPAVPPPLDLQARIAQIRQDIANESQGRQDIVSQLGKAA